MKEKKEPMTMTANDIADAVQSNPLLAVPISEWRPTLSSECQVYVFGEQYLAKRFDQINYKIVNKDEAKEVVIDNLYALLRSKYFVRSTEESDARIKQIVSSFTDNLKTTLRRVSLKKDDDCEKVSFLPASCIAFRNGVYDFNKNKWLFKYDIIQMKNINNKVYMYDPHWLIMWYMDFNFEPMDFSINDYGIEVFVKAMKDLVKTKENYCFKLVYNMAHDSYDRLSMDKFKYLCQVIGYMLLQSFNESFVILVGSGGNGKNSLFDGCLTSHVVPMPASNSMDDFENDRFISGSLVNKAQNIYLETTPKTIEVSKTLKNITGSMYQTIESKGANKYSGLLNCKYLWSANDQDMLKFADNTAGFRRRIQILEIFYSWDELGAYLRRGDYYAISFSQDLHEIKDNLENAIMFCYLGMYGLKLGTNDFTKDFTFAYNDWNQSYSDVDLDFKDAIDNLTIADVNVWLKRMKSMPEGSQMLYDMTGSKLYMSDAFRANGGRKSVDGIIEMLDDAESTMAFFAENNVWISVKSLQSMSGIINKTSTAFTQSIKKVYGLQSRDIRRFANNQPYVMVRIGVNNRLKIVKI